MSHPVDPHDLESAIARLHGFIDIVESDARQSLTDPEGLLESARTAIQTLQKSLRSEEASPTSSLRPKRLFLQFAMRLEANPLISMLNPERVSFDWAKALPSEFYLVRRDGLEIYLGIAGVDPVYQVDSIGSVPAAVLASLAIQHLRPDLVVNAGTCGGFQSQGHAIAQVFVGAHYVAFHHRRSTIPAMRDYGIGKYPVADSALLRAKLGLPEGIVSSGDALDYSKEDQEYFAANGGTLKEMEAAAIGWICQLTRTPLLPVKTVTDWVDHPACTVAQFKTNYGQAVGGLTKELSRILDYLSGNPEDPVWK